MFSFFSFVSGSPYSENANLYSDESSEIFAIAIFSLTLLDCPFTFSLKSVLTTTFFTFVPLYRSGTSVSSVQDILYLLSSEKDFFILTALILTPLEIFVVFPSVPLNAK